MNIIDKKFIRTLSMLGSCGAYGLACLDIAENDKNFLALTADLCFYSGLDRFKTKFPKQFINVGIAEQNLLGISGGLSKEGYNVFVSTYASFACTRALDQVKVNMGYMRLPIKLIGLTSGFSVGVLGTTHVCIEDISIMRSIPNITILSPADSLETYKMILSAKNINRPIYIRLSGTLNNPIVYNEDYKLEIGKAVEIITEGEYAIFATGTMVNFSLRIAKELKNKGINIRVINFHTIKPLDEDMIINMAKICKKIYTVEEHTVLGGFGSTILECMNKYHLNTYLKIIGVEDKYALAGDYNYLLAESGLCIDSIKHTIEEDILNNNIGG